MVVTSRRRGYLAHFTSDQRSCDVACCGLAPHYLAPSTTLTRNVETGACVPSSPARHSIVVFVVGGRSFLPSEHHHSEYT